MTPTIALVPPDIDELPAPWVWWHGDGSVTAPPTQPVIPIEDDAPLDAYRDLTPTGRRRWVRTVRGRSRRQLAAASNQIVTDWLAGDDSAADRLNQLPDDWRHWTLRRLGHGTFAASGGAPSGPPATSEPTRRETATGDRPDGDGWQLVVEYVPVGSVEIDGCWYDPAEIAGLARVGPGQWVRLADRVARAPAGTPVPDDWTEQAPPSSGSGSTLGDSLKWSAPPGLDWAAALECWDAAQSSSLRVVVVRPRPNNAGEWVAWRGIGGHAITVGRHPTRDAAVDAAMEAILVERDRLAWLADMTSLPPVEVIEAESPGWDATRSAASGGRHDSIEPVGLAEIAQRLGVARQTVDSWQHRGVLPAPDWTVGGRPAWRWDAIEAWARATGRA